MRYAYICDECNNEEIRIVPLSERNNQICECGNRLRQDWSKKTILVDQTLGYYDSCLGQYIGSSSDRRRAEGDEWYALDKGESIQSVVKKRKKEPTKELKEAVGRAVNMVSEGYRVPQAAV
jgi:predicted nucleic acid-binding Zn ribbon protein